MPLLRSRRVAVLPVIAWYENHVDEQRDAGFRSPEVRALVDTALADMSLADPDTPQPAVRQR